MMQSCVGNEDAVVVAEVDPVVVEVEVVSAVVASGDVGAVAPGGVGGAVGAGATLARPTTVLKSEPIAVVLTPLGSSGAVHCSRQVATAEVELDRHGRKQSELVLSLEAASVEVPVELDATIGVTPTGVVSTVAGADGVVSALVPESDCRKARPEEPLIGVPSLNGKRVDTDGRPWIADTSATEETAEVASVVLVTAALVGATLPADMPEEADDLRALGN